MNTQYRFNYNKHYGFTADNVEELRSAVKDLSFTRLGVLGSVDERIVDGTLGVEWVASKVCFKINVPAHFITHCPNTIYCIDGCIVSGFNQAIAYVMDLLYCSRDEACSLVLSI